MTKALTQAQKTAKAAARKAKTGKSAAPPVGRVPFAPPDQKGSGLREMAQDLGQQERAQERRDDMPDNDRTMHQGVHDDAHTVAQHFDGEVHDGDMFPENWAPPAALEAPQPNPNMVQRFVRMSVKGKNDGENLTAMARQGWRPRTLESVPEGGRRDFSTMKDPRTGGSLIVNGDLILCEMPKRLFDQMSAFYAAKRKGQVAALVDKPLAGAAIAGAEKHGFGAPHVAERSSNVRTDRIPIVGADR